MGRNLDELLHYYQHELVMNERLREEFARRHPSLAAALGATTSGGAEQDPHIQRLLQATALMNAHTAMRIDAGGDWLSGAVLQQNYPHYLRPVPSYTIAQCDAGQAPIDTVATIERGTLLHGSNINGVVCTFRTAYPVTIAPIKLTSACFRPAAQLPMQRSLGAGTSHVISITIESTAGTRSLAELGLERLPLFIDADAALSAVLRDTLFIGVTSAWLDCRDGDDWLRLPTLPLRSVGYEDDEALLPFPARSHRAYRLLIEHACFPEKFNFVDIDLAAFAGQLPAGCRRFTLHFSVGHLGHDSDPAFMLAQLGPQHLRLFCTPAANLFPKAACAIELDHSKTEYVVPTDATRPAGFDIFSVDSVKAIKGSADGSGEAVEYFPYFSIQHGVAGGRHGRYWSLRRDELLADISPGHEHAISFVDLDFNPLDVEVASVSINLTCTNGDLPSRMSFGAADGDLDMAEPLGRIPIRILRKPTRSYRFSSKDNWRLIAHLSLNHHSLVQGDVAPLAELLTLYNLPQSPINQRQIAGMVSLTSCQTRMRWRERHSTGYIQGVEVRLTVDQRAYAGAGLHAFVQVLDHFFGLYVHLNSFVQLVVICHQSEKEILRCPARSGSQQLL